MAPAVLGALFSVGVAFADDSDELICRAKGDWGRATTSDSPSNTRVLGSAEARRQALRSVAEQNLAALSKKPLLDLEFE
ncbi:hypothetical protein Bca4012_043585 [Brassica carinata]|uniref:Uncharacterized protein n=1 Tax=Brassica carinata TaxID=52824 RepID=A0A8X7QUJ2_BRACI|nr:hypothetical protein Bca52824_058747 [Brassica carinata]